MDPLITVCIPHHDGWSLLRELLDSLGKTHAETAEFQVMVVDNASDDGSREMINDLFPKTHVIEMGENVGFAPALNRAAESSQTPWLAFLNNDMRIHPRCLLEALRITQTHNVDCVGCRIMDWQGIHTQFAGGEINLLGKGFEWGENEVDVEQERSLLFPCGGAMLIRRDLFLQAGGFDADYGMIYEDVDLGWRLNLFGHSIRYAPKAIVYHRRHASLAKVSYTRKAIFLERNSLATMYKNLGAENWAVVLPELMRLGIQRTKSMTLLPEAGYDHLRGVQAFFDDLPRWRRKRRDVQSQRKVSDTVILSRFFLHPTRLWAYADEHRRAMCRGEYLKTRQSILERVTRELGLPNDS